MAATAPRSSFHGRSSLHQPLPSLGAGLNSDERASPDEEDDDTMDATSSYSSPSEDSDLISSSPKDDGAQGLVTAEMFWRDVLRDPPTPVVKRPGSGKKSKKEYRVMDNRDSLPFAVQLATPDPYSPPDATKPKGRGGSTGGAAAPTPRRRNHAMENKISSQLFVEGDRAEGIDDPSDAARTLLGEYQLDKHTTTGDVLLIGEHQYKVVSHRCLYKYAGGQRFVMMKKILHVKEVGRWQAEEYLHRQWKNSPPSVGSAGDPPLELH
jgi:hypothetical protein